MAALEHPVSKMDIDIEGHEYLTFIPDPWKGKYRAPIDWFRDHFPEFIYSKEHVLGNCVPYELNDGPNKGGVYFLILEGDICYVGQSNAIYRRLIQHHQNNMPFTHYWCFGGMPELFVEAIESYYIRKFEPPFNDKHLMPHEVVAPYL